MDQKTINILLIISSMGLLVSGVIFLCLSIFTEPKNNTYLCVALGCIVLSNLFNLIRSQYGKNQK